MRSRRELARDRTSPLISDRVIAVAMVVLAVPAGFSMGYAAHQMWTALVDGLSRGVGGP